MTWGQFVSIIDGMGKIHQQGNVTIRVNGNEHPPVHAHVLHPDGKAVVYLDGRVLNSGVPEAALRGARTWIAAHAELVIAEWNRWN